MTRIRCNGDSRWKMKNVGAYLFALSTLIFFAGVYISPSRIVTFFAAYTAMTAVYFVYFKKLKMYYTTLDFAWALYLLAGVIGAFASGIGITKGLGDFALSISLGLLLSLMAMSCIDREKQINAIWGICILVLIGCGMQFLAQDALLKITKVTLDAQQYTWHTEFIFLMKRVVGFSYQTGVTAHYLCLFEILLIGMWCKSGSQHWSKRLFCIGGFLAGLVLILLTEKRSNLLVVLILFAVMFYFAYHKRFLKYALAAIAVFVVAITATETGRSLINRTLGSNPFSGRLDIYGILWEMIKMNPLLGNGLGSTLVYVTKYTNGHNIYLQTWAECGLLGLAMLVIILAVNLKRAIKLMKCGFRTKSITSMEIFCVGYQIYFIVIGMIGNPLYDIYPLAMYMLTVGMVKSARVDYYRELKGTV